MHLSEALLPEFDREMALTRTSIERAPEASFDWKPHPKSPTLAWLVGFLAVLPSWTVMILTQPSLDIEPEGKPPTTPPLPRTILEVLETFDRNVTDARAAILATSNEEFGKAWTLLRNGQKLMSMPRAAVLRGMVMNHMVHHRAQLGVYLRLLDVPVPAIYGPSADEGWGK
jgi:uncharacterized damage-inducible protein DinB